MAVRTTKGRWRKAGTPDTVVPVSTASRKAQELGAARPKASAAPVFPRAGKSRPARFQRTDGGRGSSIRLRRASADPSAR
jgi:hypothetical protein